MLKQRIFKFAVVTTLFFVSLVSLFAPLFSSNSFGWFSSQRVTPHGAEVMPGFYAGGSGTEDDPYLITRPIHLYNLAWLQLKGEYNQLKNDENGQPTYTQTYFELCNDISMSGYTLPPIGTQEYPFIGVFTSSENNNFIISDLTVSNVVDNGEIVKRPQGINDITGVEIVGMFGVVGSDDGVDNSYSSIVPKVENFILENPIIRTQTEKSLVGLIAGYVNDGNLNNVGVIGGALVSGDNNTQGIYEGDENLLSLYALIGNRSTGVDWDGVNRPDSAGGTIKVDVGDSETYSAINNRVNYHVAIPGSKPGHAYAVGDDLEAGTTGKFNGRKYFNKVIRFRETGNTIVGTNKTASVNIQGQFVSFSASTYSQGWLDTNINNSIASDTDKLTYSADLKTALDRSTNYTLTTGSNNNYPKASSLRQINTPSGTISVPDDGVWFKPIAAGRGIVSFYMTNNGGNNKFKSIYRYKRIDSTTIDTSSWQEMKLDIGSVGNKNLAVFEFELTTADLDYEYIVGSTSGVGDEVEFYFLALAGASNTGAAGGIGDILNVNFIPQGYTGVIVPAGKKVNTVYITFKDYLTKVGLDQISFERSSIDATVTATVNNDLLNYNIYEHLISS